MLPVYTCLVERELADSEAEVVDSFADAIWHAETQMFNGHGVANTSSAAPSEPRASTARSQAVGHHRWNERSARRSPTQ